MTEKLNIVTVSRRLSTDVGFILCAACMVIGIISIQRTIAVLGGNINKKPLELKAPLDQLDENALKPFVVRYKNTIDNETMLTELGTEQYITWDIVNSQPNPDDHYTRANLFVTYYTGDPGLVPHIPDVCYLGGGYKKDKTINRVILVHGEKIPVRILEVSKALSDGTNVYYTIGYFFNANGIYMNDRYQVRYELNDPKLEYAYFSKIEFTVQDNMKQPDQEEVLRLITRMSEKVVPLLEANHFPEIPTPGDPLN